MLNFEVEGGKQLRINFGNINIHIKEQDSHLYSLFSGR